MSVEDRVRRGLHANALAFVPEGERRLVEVRRRHRTRTGALAAGGAAAVVVAAAVAGSVLWGSDRSSSPEPAPTPATTPATTSASAYTGPRIPDSAWRKVVTRAQLVRAGADEAFLAENLGRQDRIPITLTFGRGGFIQSGRYPEGLSVGDYGTVEYDTDGRLVLTSSASGCSGCAATLTWRIDGNRLILDGFRSSPDDPIAQVNLEGVWTRVDG